MNAQRRADDIGILVGQARDEGIRITHFDHHRAKNVDITHTLASNWICHAFTLAQFMVSLSVLIKLFEFKRVDNHRFVIQTKFLDPALNDIGATQQNRKANLLIRNLHSSADHFRLFAFSKDNTLRTARHPSLVLEEISYLLSLALAICQLLFVFIDVDRLAGHTGLHGHFSDRRCLPEQYTRIERSRDNVFTPKFQAFFPIGSQNGIWDILFSQRSQRLRSRQFHFLVDGFSADIQCTTEDEGKAKYVVNLVRVI